VCFQDFHVLHQVPFLSWSRSLVCLSLDGDSGTPVTQTRGSNDAAGVTT